MVELHPLLFLELAVCKGSDQGFAEEFGLFSLDVQLAVITLKTTKGSYKNIVQLSVTYKFKT